MPAQPVSINLLGDQDLQHTAAGRIVSWAVTYGRYIMIGTEIAVLLAFISRFSLDRKKVDLSDEIEQKQIILQSNSATEQNIRTLQARLSQVKSIISKQQDIYSIIVFIRSVLPTDIYLEKLSTNQNKLTIEASANTTDSFALFLSQLRESGKFSSLDLGEIKKSQTTGISFQITAQIEK